ncbi:hypothetical protein [Sphingosinicella terrae]|uniref:hypothetical protein n=1 Tax=Sphingosinicella terrae TaxID=2172047 RepID=UPI000E0D58C2|nr:hypothetical protein [Sphingosinicella terrae]
MATGAPKQVIGRSFATMNEARAHARVLVESGMQARVFGPVKSGFIVGPSGEALSWPAGEAEGWLVIGTDSQVETPPQPSS